MDIRTTHALGAAVRGRRRTLNLTQAQVAKAAGVSRQWLADFESGKPTVELGRALAALEALDLTLDLRPAGETSAETSTGELRDLASLIESYERGDE
ncbi:y4mF family transcriptional regulator [Kribbella sp. VKM Ac-2527]|uniref:Y4mF family transcriptional regulator n=1 Tax=Kribbella caucasensis TaxID=2512215 RepID=A0A4R6K6M3_9ACTN|nr:helix-turn-helix domain-containing protein [Kribbella sp. VKM Ac-2527]TDO45005.1 y4mF family transcriptional regulator [Kribbella sp. VKM Ac-2527]